MREGMAVRFIRDRRGNYGIMIAVLILPILVLAVKTFDFFVASSMRSDLQGLADAVALASVKGLQTSEASALEAGEATYSAGLIALGFKLDSEQLDLKFKTAPDLVSKVVINVTFAGIFGDSFAFQPETVEVRAQASIHQRELEVAVATDFSPSMDTQEIAVLIKSLRTLTDALFDLKTSDYPVRMALAPFTRNVALPTAYAGGWVSGTGTATPGRICVGPRSVATDATDTTPIQTPFPAFKESATYCPSETLQPLTARKDDIVALIDRSASRLGPYRGTGVYEGLAWNYRLLSPKWRNVWPAGSEAKPYPKARKVAVIMTDGANDASVGYTKPVADGITLQACKNMKADGIEIFVITYKVTSDLVSLYSQCATSAAYFVDSPDDTALAKAFDELTKRLRADGPVLEF